MPPAAARTISAAMPPEQRGLAASIILSTTNYSISLSLAIAAMMSSIYNDQGHESTSRLSCCVLLRAIGLSGLGVAAAMGVCLTGAT
jgi:hypothetical protein